jgi:AdoMet-dependent heme synthase
MAMRNPCSSDSFYIQWHILDRCNLRCLHCYQYDFSKDREPGWPEMKHAADNLLNTMNSWGTKLDAALTGGEPFLKPELFQLLDYLDNSKHVGSLCIITNGTIWPEFSHRLKELSKMNEIRISLDGISEKTNDEIRGKGVLNKVLQNIGRWRELNIPVTLMFTVMKRNLHEIPFLLEFGKKLGINGIIIERFFPIGQGEKINNDVLDSQEFFGVWNSILEQIGIAADVEDIAPYRAVRINFDGDETDVLGSGCIVAKDGMALLPDGTVLPCRRFTLPIGNIMEKPLDEIWRHSPVLNALKDKSQLKGKCGQCNITDCQGCRAMCYCLEKDFLSEDVHCLLPGK